VTALERSRDSTVVALRDRLYTACIDMLFAYRKYCAQNTTPGQLILPEALKFLPVYVLALSKSAAFRTSASLSVGG
jgi:protein transport protein SEC24